MWIRLLTVEGGRREEAMGTICGGLAIKRGRDMQKTDIAVQLKGRNG